MSSRNAMEKEVNGYGTKESDSAVSVAFAAAEMGEEGVVLREDALRWGDVRGGLANHIGRG